MERGGLEESGGREVQYSSIDEGLVLGHRKSSFESDDRAME